MNRKQTDIMKLLTAIAFLLFIVSPTFALDNTTYTCLNGNLLQINTSIEKTENGVVSNITLKENYFCEKGCLQGATNCIGQAAESNFGIPIIIMLTAICVVFFYVSFAMNPEHVHMRWFFFFLGYIVVLGMLFAGYTIAYDTGKDNLADQIQILIFVLGTFFFILLVYILMKMTRNLFKGIRAKKEEKLIGPN